MRQDNLLPPHPTILTIPLQATSNIMMYVCPCIIYEKDKRYQLAAIHNLCNPEDGHIDARNM
jgi:hypothetical protein